ncbi:MAG: phage holin family protein [Polyangia bacterium]
MAIISAIFSLLSRKLGDLLQALFGWSITGLFGRLPSKKQTALSLALILSILWPLLVVGCFLPKVAAWAVAFLPLQQWLGKGLLRGLWITLALVSPLLVGVIVSWVAPSRKQKGGVLRTILSGFPLTVGLFLSFLLTFFVVPVLKLVAMARRWEDEHVYLQVKEDAYADVLSELKQACEKAGVTVHSLPVPKVMQAPLRVLRWFARSGIEPLVASEPRMLKGEGIELFLYPADLLIRGTTERTRRVRAAMVREMMPAPAYLTQDPKAQHLEDLMNGAWGMLARHQSLDEVKDAAQERVRELGKGLDEADIPYDDWVLLYSERLRLQRAVGEEPDLKDLQDLHGLQDLNRANRLAPVAEEGAMAAIDPDPNVSTVALVKEAMDEARALLKTEIALARDEAQKQIDAVKTAGIAMGSAAVAAILGLSMLLVALVMAVFPHALAALLTGIILLVGAGVSALIGYGRLPKKPLAQTQQRLEADAQVLKERIA